MYFSNNNTLFNKKLCSIFDSPNHFHFFRKYFCPSNSDYPPWGVKPIIEAIGPVLARPPFAAPRGCKSSPVCPKKIATPSDSIIIEFAGVCGAPGLLLQPAEVAKAVLCVPKRLQHSLLVS